MAQSNTNYSVYGDAAVSTATIVSNTNQFTGDIVTTSHDPNSGKQWQNLILQGDIWENHSQREFPKVVTGTNTLGQVQWDFTLLGEVEMDKMMLEFAVNITTSHMSTPFSWANMPQGCYAMLNCIKSIKLQIGLDSYPVASEQMNELMPLKIALHTWKRTPTQHASVAHLGMPFSIGTFPAPGATYTSASQYGGYYDSTQAAINSKTTAGDVRYLSFPLSAVIPFMAQANTRYPNQMRIQIKLEWDASTNPITVYSAPLLVGVPTVSTSPQSILIGTGYILPQSFTISYVYLILREQYAREFNLKWVAKAFIFNYLFLARYERAFQANEIMVNWGDIQQNIQRPLEVLIFPMLAKGVDVTTISSTSGFGNFYSYPHSFAAGWIINFLRIYASGQIICELWNNRTVQEMLNTPSIDPSMMFLNYVSEQNDKNQADVIDTQIGRMNGLRVAMPLVIPLSPGMFYKRGINTLDGGPVTLKIELSITDINGAALGPNYNLHLYTRTPRQLQVTSDHRVIEVSWPAVATDSGYVLNRTINVN